MIDDRIQIICESRCQLNCVNCAKPYLKKYPESFMDMNTFKSIVDKCVYLRIPNYELTPTIGEPFLDKHLFERIEYLNTFEEVKKIYFFTNLLILKESDILFLSKFKKLEITVSVYGDSEETYFKNTGTHNFNVFLKNMNLLSQKLDKDKIKLSFGMRFSEYNPKKLLINLLKNNNGIYTSLHVLIQKKVINIEDIWDTAHHSNWGEMANIPNEKILTKGPSIGIPNRKGICVYALEDNGILPNGDITLCGWFDINRVMIIGNILKDGVDHIFSKESKYHEILEDQKNGIYTGICRFCTLSGNPRLKELGYTITEDKLENTLPRYLNKEK